MNGQSRRQEERILVNEPCIIYAGNRAIPAQMVDTSFNGARLLVKVGVDVPDEFELFETPALPMRACRVVHRSEEFIGIRFV